MLKLLGIEFKLGEVIFAEGHEELALHLAQNSNFLKKVMNPCLTRTL